MPRDFVGDSCANFRWSVGVTTAPRRVATLSRTLASVAAAGWSEARLFAEPGSELPDDALRLACSQRDVPLGAFPNWVLGLAELVLREPESDAYLMLQDDVLLTANVRGYLERTLWPRREVGLVSLYTPSHYSAGKTYGYHEQPCAWDSWGALAYVFPNPAARALLADPLLVDHRRHGPAGGLRNIDSVVGLWRQRRRLPYIVHVPSLAQHIGETSTLWPRATTAGQRRADTFVETI